MRVDVLTVLLTYQPQEDEKLCDYCTHTYIHERSEKDSMKILHEQKETQKRVKVKPKICTQQELMAAKPAVPAMLAVFTLRHLQKNAKMLVCPSSSLQAKWEKLAERKRQREK